MGGARVAADERGSEAAREFVAYDVFGLRVRSEILLPDLFEARGEGVADVSIKLAPVNAPAPGEPSVWGLTGDGGYAVLTVENIARYAIIGGNSIVIDRAEGVAPADVRLFLLGSACGALFHQRGLLPLHANAIAIGDGAAAFMGRSGAGKSTMAGALLDRGFPLLADDVCVVTQDADGRALAQPGLPRLRLWRDAVEASGRNSADLEVAFVGHEKYVVPTRAGQAREALPLTRIYLLGELGEGETGQRIRRLTGVEALQCVMANIYRGHYLPLLGGTERNLHQCVKLVRTVPVFEVRRQWGYDVIDEQMQLIEAHARSEN